MIPTGTTAAAIALALAAASCTATSGTHTTEKRIVTCSDIVEVYRASRSIDQTSSQLRVDQSVVDACVRAAGIEMPRQYNR